MKNQIIMIAVIALLIGGIGGYIISRSDEGGHGWMMRGWSNDEKNKEVGNFESKDDTTPGMHDMHGMAGANTVTERDFITDMIPHHQEAVDTAKQVVARGSNADARALAQSIIIAQEKEIVSMKSWYQAWYSEAYKADDSYKPMMRDLSALSGEELDKAFLEDMIAHHMGALILAQQLAPNIEHTEMQTLAQNIAKTQSEEIITMRILLKQL